MVNILASAMYATADVVLLITGMVLFLFGLVVVWSAISADYSCARCSEILRHLAFLAVWFLIFIFLGSLSLSGMVALEHAHPILSSAYSIG